MNKKKLYWVIQVIGWSVYGLLQVIGANFVAANRILSWSDYLPLIMEALAFFLATHLIRNIIIYRRWLTLPVSALVPRLGLLLLSAAFFAFSIRVSTIHMVGMYQDSLLSLSNVFGNIAINLFLVFLWVIFYFIYHYFDRYNQSLRYEAAIHEIELNNLKSQLNPHFMFNALNSIRAMVDDEPEKSKTAITQLSNILRNSLASDKKRLTTFREEMNTVKDYLSLESIRYEERLKVIYDIHPDSFKFLIPPLMLQTLVENGIKHGISRLKNGGTILIKTTINERNLKLQIKNTGHYKNESQKNAREGFGIQNTIKRLELIYGDRKRFKIYNEKNNIVTSELLLPAVTDY